MIKIICKKCKKIFYVKNSRRNTAGYCSNKCYNSVRGTLVKGENHPHWKGDKASYISFHTWLWRNFGKANKCENKNCTKHSTRFEWALKKGKSHSHKRENYFQLCKSCHNKLDMTKESRKKAAEKMRGHPSWNNWQKIPRDFKGKFCNFNMPIKAVVKFS